MSDKKLTPRVGDRVLFRTSVDVKSYIGTVTTRGPGWWFRVDVDGDMPRDIHREDLTVLDRGPVEWPEGWSRAIHVDGARLAGVAAFTRDELAAVLATGPDMLAHWDELMGGDA